ncbi:polysaccharide deacetylase family protein [Breznakiella homolactica]|uniref:Polysaccharide deacetylase family protein n=1 Tax=Breznakiella homolactica TaxID=2798577 RepID=A0A7T7XPK8_9SPIR|nr:polysaccharide deacetylase family protein [Breznakiella homolactica]QQO10184.1 polysaccharide deacetylase family protein [Breznakiella homolactica]
MRYIGFSFSFNIQRCEVEVGDEAPIVEQGYWPLLRTLDTYRVPADLYITGYSTGLINTIDRSLADFIRARLGKGLALGTYTYTHPIPQILAPEEMRRQVMRGITLDRNNYGLSPKGFFPPEFARTNELSRILLDCGLEYTIVLSNFLEQAHPELPEAERYAPYDIDLGGGKSLTAVPISPDLPTAGRRFFKRMLLGELTPAKAAEALFAFVTRYDDIFVILERDAETIYIDELSSGVTHTKERLEEFLELVTRNAPREGFALTTIEDYLKIPQKRKKLRMPDFPGITKLETFTHGPSRELWEKTLAVRERLLSLDRTALDSENRFLLDRAWEHILLSHNSDGRIGDWQPEWKPGKHITAASRKQFVADNLKAADTILSRIEQNRGTGSL